ncbi:MAG: hypothetical protein U0271_10020 [Polyangiaceae bacterium]
MLHLASNNGGELDAGAGAALTDADATGVADACAAEAAVDAALDAAERAAEEELTSRAEEAVRVSGAAFSSGLELQAWKKSALESATATTLRRSSMVCESNAGGRLDTPWLD